MKFYVFTHPKAMSWDDFHVFVYVPVLALIFDAFGSILVAFGSILADLGSILAAFGSLL